jgi:hypothetical protein
VRRHGLVALGLAVACAAATVRVGRRSDAEPLPTEGTFDGTYHLDRWGRAHVSFFVVPPNLRERFEGLEGVPVRIEVLEGEQESIPGPVQVKSLGSVKRIEGDPRASLAVETWPTTPVAGDRPIVRLTVRNVGASPFDLRPRESQVDHLCEPDSRRSKDSRFPSLRRDGFGVPAESWSTWEVLQRLEPGEAMSIQLESKEPLEAGTHEYGVSARVKERVFETWKAFDVAAAGTRGSGTIAPPPLAGLRATEVATALDGSEEYAWQSHDRPVLAIDTVLKADAPPGPRLSWGALKDGKGRTTRVALRAFAADGEEVPLSTWTQVVRDGARGGFLENGEDVEGAWFFAPIAETGLRLHAVAWTRSAFPPPMPWRVVAEVRTDLGVLRTTLLEGVVPAFAVVDVPFGAERDRLRLRARPALDPMPRSGRRAVFFEIRSAGDAPMIFLLRGTWKEWLVLEVDGKEVAVDPQGDGALGSAAAHTVREAAQGVVHLSPDVAIPPGEHEMRFGLRARGGRIATRGTSRSRSSRASSGAPRCACGFAKPSSAPRS